MRIAFLLVVFLHGILHLLGFIKAFGIKEVQELTVSISKPMGLLWFLSALFFLTYGWLYHGDHKYVWLSGLLAVLISQTLIFLFWQDAKWGTLPNILILFASILSFGHYHFQNRIDQETADLLRQNSGIEGELLEEADISGLPGPVQKWLRHSRVIGKPHIYLGKIIQKGEMKLKPDQGHWMSATAKQYTDLTKPAFIWSTQVKMNPFIYFHGRDRFVNGKGEMLIKVNSLFNAVDAQGKKIDEGAIQRYLGEMVWFPSLALSPYVTWEAIDDTSAKATIKYMGTQGSGTFYFTSEGDFVKFSAMRFMGNEADSQRHEWILSVDGYKNFAGIKIPAVVNATWKLDTGDWTWLKLEIMDLRYNENAL